MIEENQTNENINLNIEDDDFNLELFSTQPHKYPSLFIPLALGTSVSFLPQTMICASQVRLTILYIPLTSKSSNVILVKSLFQSKKNSALDVLDLTSISATSKQKRKWGKKKQLRQL